jgi:hypothetical protein
LSWSPNRSSPLSAKSFSRTAHRQQQDGETRLIELSDPGFELLNRAAQLALQAVARIHAEDALGADDVLEPGRIEVDSASQLGDLPNRIAFRRGGREGFEPVEQGDFFGNAAGKFLASASSRDFRKRAAICCVSRKPSESSDSCALKRMLSSDSRWTCAA